MSNFIQSSIQSALNIKTERNQHGHNINLNNLNLDIEVDHPFIKTSKEPPNNCNMVLNFDDLFPAKLDLTDHIRRRGLLRQVNFNVVEQETNIDVSNVNVKTQDTEKITEDMTIRQIVETNPPIGWEEVFINAAGEYEFIDEFLKHQERIYNKYIPKRKDIFKSFHLCPLYNVKVVIVGQDPYYSMYGSDPIANGMAFSVDRNYPRIPPSLNNIFNELNRSMPETFRYPDHGDLSAWARQGVLLLNKSLTVNQNISDSHKKLWDGFITVVIKAIEEINPNCIFVLWGGKAKSLTSKISSTILTSSHPSPKSFKLGFSGCNHFVLINEQLVEFGFQPIDWNLD